MSSDGFGAGALELHAEVAEEARVPFVFVRFEKAVGLFVGEEVEDQGAQGGGVADRGVGVEDPGI